MRKPRSNPYALFTALTFLFLGKSVIAAEERNLPATMNMAESDIAGNLIQTSLGLILILALIAGAAWLVKRFGNFKVGAQGRMKIVGGLSLGTRERVVLLQVGEQQLVVGVTPGRIQTLHVLDEPLSVDSTTLESSAVSKRLVQENKNSFAEKLSAVMNVARGNRS